MTLRVPTDDEIVQEAEAVLLRHMGAARVARLWSAWRLGQGDYLVMRDELFANETVDSLVAAIDTYQASSGATQ